MIIKLRQSNKGDVYTLHVGALYFGRDTIHSHKIKGDKDHCMEELREICFLNVLGSFSKFIGPIYSRKDELKMLEDKENIDYLYRVAEWMVDGKNKEGVTLELVCKQVLKIEKRLVAMIHVLRDDKSREVELLALLQCCKENKNGVSHYIN